jgi:hypothetical protein
MSSDARLYAEQKLGVHTVFEEAVEIAQQLDDELVRLDKAQDDKRRLEEEYADREVELISEMRGMHPNMSDTRFKSEFRGWERTDETLRKIRRELNITKSVIQGSEIDIEVMRMRVKIGCARMTELGGYLNYLAAVMKQAEKSNKTEKDSA